MPVLLVVTSAVVLASLIGFSERLKKEVKQANETYSQLIVQFLDYSLGNIDSSMIKESQNDGRFQVFFEPILNQIAQVDNFTVSHRLQEYMISNPLVDSMYLYRIQDNHVLSSSWTGSLQDYPDESFVESSLNQSTPYHWTSLRTFTEFPEVETPRMVISLVRKVRDEGLIIVNVNPKQLQTLLKENFKYQGNENIFSLYDQSGQVLLTLEDKTAAPSKDSPAVLSSVHSSYSGFELQSSVKNTELLGILSSISWTWIIFIVVALLSGAIWILFVTRRNVEPLQSIVKRIEAFAKPEGQEKDVRSGRFLDEFKYIDFALEDLMNTSNNFQKEHEENLFYKRQILFEELLEGSRIVTVAEWEKELQEFGLNPYFDLLSVMIFEIDRFSVFSKQYSQRDQNLFKYVILNVLQEISEHQAMRIWAEWTEESNQLVAICLADGGLEDCKNNLIRLGELVRDWVQHHLHFTVSLGVGTVVPRPEDLSISCDEARNALKYKLSLGLNRVIPAWDLNGDTPDEMFKYLQIIRSMAQSYRLGESKWEEDFSAFFDLLKASNFRREDITGLISYLIYNMYRNLMELSKEYQALWLEHTLPRLNENLQQFDDLQEIQVNIHAVLKEAFNEMVLIRENKSQYGVSRKICDYIEQHYMDPNLSLNQLSEAFEYHANYLSKLFKDEIGERFVNYLARVRIDHAKELLMTTSLTVQDVALRVGYEHVYSFMRVFKKLAGMPPGEYRKQVKGESAVDS